MVSWCRVNAVCCVAVGQTQQYSLRSLFIPLSDRSSWDQLTARTVQLLRQLLAACPQERVTLVGESVRMVHPAPAAHCAETAYAACRLSAIMDLPTALHADMPRCNEAH